jgi:KUP system potassium uptake protein
MSISNPEFSSSALLNPVEVSGSGGEHKKSLGVMMLAAIGVVFGDIGTSPLYALKECFDANHGIAYSREALFGVISMMIWALILVVTVKYVLFVMRADNKGEGGVLSLMALALRSFDSKSKSYFFFMIMGMLGACMLLGESVITPAISVLSAVEGIEIAAPGLKKFIIPVSLIILVGLFLIQRYGTAVVGKLFGPITLVWFLTLAALGVWNIGDSPEIIGAFNPLYAVDFVVLHPTTAYIVMGAVVLVVTGVEALYLDMGHFGRTPVRYAWLFIVLPSLLINYLGQGALVLSNPEAIKNPFYLMVPDWALWPTVALATAATVIASQAVISGAYSLVSQAILLGFMPRMNILHTSDSEQGQIYIPLVNWALLFMVVITIIEFRESVNLAAAYGISVTSVMIITTILLAVVMLREWKMNVVFVALITIIFFFVDLAFWTANLIKIKDGGWYPLALGLLCFTCLITWYRGRQILRQRAIENGIQLSSFISVLLEHPPHRVDGTAIFLTAHVDYLPVSFLHNLKHNHVLHKRVFFLKVSIWDVPHVKDEERINLRDLGNGIYVVRAVYGFNETPDVVRIIELVEKSSGLKFDLMDTSFFLSRDMLVSTDIPGMALWRERLFCWMYQNAGRQSDFFKIPTNRIVELGSKVEI